MKQNHFENAGRIFEKDIEHILKAEQVLLRLERNLSNYFGKDCTTLDDDEISIVYKKLLSKKIKIIF